MQVIQKLRKMVFHAGVEKEAFQPSIPDIREQGLDGHREELYNMSSFAITSSKSGDQGAGWAEIHQSCSRPGLHPRRKKIICKRKRLLDFWDLTGAFEGCDNKMKMRQHDERMYGLCGTEKN